MSMIFPGMDPYLANPRLWPGVHQSLIVYVRDHLRPLLWPRYVTAIEERVYLEGPDREVVPDLSVRRTIANFPARRSPAEATTVAVLEQEEESPLVFKTNGLEIHESYLTILDLRSNQRIVTVIEVVSPANKYAGPGRQSYEAKQQEVLASDTHLVEIDLLRFGPHVVAVPQYGAERMAGKYDYLFTVSRARNSRDEIEFYARRVRDKLPRVHIPLAGDDPDVRLDLRAVLAQAYEAGDYDSRVDYHQPCVPPLPPDDQDWANQLIAQAEETSNV